MKSKSLILVLGVMASFSAWADEDGGHKKKPEVSVATAVEAKHSSDKTQLTTGVQAGVKSRPLIASLDIQGGQQVFRVSGSAEVYPVRLVTHVVGEDPQSGTQTLTFDIIPLTAKGEMALNTVKLDSGKSSFKDSISNARIEVTPEFAASFHDFNSSALEKGGVFRVHVKAAVGPSAGAMKDKKGGSGKLAGVKGSLSLSLSVVVYPKKAGMIEGSITGSITPDLLSGPGTEKLGLSAAGKLGYKQNFWAPRPGEDPRNQPNWFIQAQMAATQGGVVPKANDPVAGSGSTNLGLAAGVAF